MMLCPGHQVVRGVSGASWPHQVVRAYSGGSIPYATVGLQPQQGFQIQSGLQLQGPSHVEQLERQLNEFRNALMQTQDRSAAIVQERDQRLSMQDRLVEELHQAIDGMRREAEELRRQQTELLFTNQEQARRLADLEDLLHDIQNQPSSRRRGQPDFRQSDSRHNRGPTQERGSRGHRSGAGDMAANQLAVQPVESQHEYLALGGDRIDLSLQEFFYMHPDFDIGITKHKPGWYTFDKPINKKVYIKVVGDNVIVRAGGGHIELHKWLLQCKDRAQGADY